MTTANEEHQCRICLEVSRTEALISPCACRGSSEYVHQACLESWVTESRSTKCEICREPYKVKLFVQSPRSRWRWWLAAVVALLLGAYFDKAWISFSMLGMWAFLSTNNLVVTVVDGFPRLMRSGDPVPGLESGMLLLASDGMPRQSIFYRSVVLLIAHSNRGSVGFVVNKETPGNELAPVWAGSGGPVATRGTVLLHAAATATARPVAAGVHLSQSGHEAAEALLQQGGEAARRGRLKLLRGHAGWAPRQLDGEVRSGGWLFDRLEDGDLWQDDDDHGAGGGGGGGGESGDAMWARLYARAQRRRQQEQQEGPEGQEEQEEQEEQNQEAQEGVGADAGGGHDAGRRR